MLKEIKNSRRAKIIAVLKNYKVEFQTNSIRNLYNGEKKPRKSNSYPITTKSKQSPKRVRIKKNENNYDD